jgi:hypothetical protein
VYFLIAWGLASSYFWISKEEINLVRNIQITATLAGAGFLVNIFSMIAFSTTNFYIFAASTVTIGLAAYYSLLRYLWKFSNFDAIVLASTLAIIMNLAWLRLIGMI